MSELTPDAAMIAAFREMVAVTRIALALLGAAFVLGTLIGRVLWAVTR